VECNTADLPPLAGEVGGAPWKLGLRQARSVRIRPPEKVSAVVCTAIARQGEKEVARQSHTVRLTGPEDTDSTGRQTAAELDRTMRSAAVLFERYAAGKDEIVIGDVPSESLGLALADFARRGGITNGRLTLGQFVKYLMEEERTRQRFPPPSRGGFGGSSRFGDPRQGFPGRSTGGRRGRGGAGGPIP
jgi:hypothetical protein